MEFQEDTHSYLRDLYIDLNVKEARMFVYLGSCDRDLQGGSVGFIGRMQSKPEEGFSEKCRALS